MKDSGSCNQMMPLCKFPIGMSKSTTTLSSKVFTEYLLDTQKIDYIYHLQTNITFKTLRRDLPDRQPLQRGHRLAYKSRLQTCRVFTVCIFREVNIYFFISAVDSWFDSFYSTTQTNWQEMKSKWEGVYCKAHIRWSVIRLKC